mgnify:CR=1 FL=1
MGAVDYKKLDLASFNTSKVIYMNSAFANCNQLKQVNVKSFDTSSVTNMNSMFSGCEKPLRSIDYQTLIQKNV